jgi:hypothetical protein
MQNQQIKLQKIAQLRKIIFDGEFPTEVVVVHNIPFRFTFSDKVPSIDISKQVAFLENVIECKGIPGHSFLKALPFVFFYSIVDTYVHFQIRLGKEFFELMEDFIKTPESRGLWAIYKKSSPEHIMVIDGKLNAFQQRWIVVNVSLDNEDTARMVLEVFEVLKPWLDKELFAKVREEEEHTRENVFYDEDNLETMDKKLRAKAKKIMAERAKEQKSVEDPDIITIGDK